VNLSLSSDSVLVTGGNRGLGRAIALAFAAEGARVAICGRDLAALEATAVELRALGAQCLAVRADLSQAGECERTVNAAAAAFGSLTVLVNNAAMSVDQIPAHLEDVTDMQAMERVNGKMMPALRCSRAAIAHMKRAGRGRIINIGGTSARNVFREGELPGKGSGLPQGLGNAAVSSLSKYLSEELVAYNIMVNVVHPHIVRTGRHTSRVQATARERGISEQEADAAIGARVPLGRIIEVDDIAPLVLFLASPLANAITGQSISIDGGASRTVLL